MRHTSSVRTGRLHRITLRVLLVLVLTASSFLVPAPLGVAPTPALAAPAPAITGLHASGNQILNASGQPVRLRGVNRTSGEYACIQGWGIFEGPVTDQAIQAMLSWKINAVRIPLNEDCWLNINTSGLDSANLGTNYRNAVVDYVNRLTAAGIVAILDLHWAAPGTQRADGQVPMADRDHAPAFWTSVATTFKGNTAVIFDLFNEPYPDDNTDTTAAWQCVRDGTTTAGSCPSVGYTAAGMQELLNAVRATGATNLVMIAGVAYTGVLSRWVEFRPTDTLNPPNIAASVHIYPPGSQCSTVSCWNQYLAPIAASYPIIAGEIGQTGCAHDRLDTVIDWLEGKGQHYLVWAWWTEPCASSPSYGLISDYLTGAPRPGYGQGYKDKLAALVGTTPSPSPSPSPSPNPNPGQPSFTTGASPSPSSVVRGNAVTVNAQVTSATAITAVVDVEIHNAADSQIYQWYDENVTFTAGQTKTFPATWTVPASLPPGTYTVQVGVFSLGWASEYVYNSSAATFAVTTTAVNPSPSPSPSPSAAPPSCVPRPSVTVSSRSIGGGQLAVTVTAHASSAAPANALDRVTIGTMQNGRVAMNGATVSAGGTIPLGGASTATFVVARVTPGRSTTVPFTVYDACGPWPSFVGGGPASF